MEPPQEAGQHRFTIRKQGTAPKHDSIAPTHCVQCPDPTACQKRTDACGKAGQFLFRRIGGNDSPLYIPKMPQEILPQQFVPQIAIPVIANEEAVHAISL